MSALDDAIQFADDPSWDTAAVIAARAELALLRRCRDAVVAATRFARNDGMSWWLQDAEDTAWCGVCGRLDVGDGIGDGIHHADGCPAVEIDKLAKEVRDE